MNTWNKNQADYRGVTLHKRYGSANAANYTQINSK